MKLDKKLLDKKIMKRLLSGIRVSGDLHIGNYFGAIAQWIDMQERHEALVFLADLHGLTTLGDRENIGERTLELTKLYIALGLDPKKCTMFVQSHVPAHTELSWILSTIAYMGEMSRMTQFKEKSEGQENVNLGLFAYPVLMAADILLYKPDVVPVGDDQKQHLELTRDLAQRFNNRFGQVFVVPEPKILSSEVARVKSLLEPDKKMSKTGQAGNAIFLLDVEEDIRHKIKTAVTDSGSEVKFDPENKPAISNLMTIYALATGHSDPPVGGEESRPSTGLGSKGDSSSADLLRMTEVEEEFAGKGYGEFKEKLADALVEFLSPIQEKYNQISDDEIKEVLKDGAEKAGKVANETLGEVKEAVGLLV